MPCKARLTLPMLLGATLFASNSVVAGEVTPSCANGNFSADITLEPDENCSVRLQSTNSVGDVQNDETTSLNETTRLAIPLPDGELSRVSVELACTIAGSVSEREQTTRFAVPSGCGTPDSSNDIVDDCTFNGIVISDVDCVRRGRLLALMRELGFSNNRIGQILAAFDNGNLNLPRRVENLLNSNLSIGAVADRLSGPPQRSTRTRRSRGGQGGGPGQGGQGGGNGGAGGAPGQGGQGAGNGGDGGGPGEDGQDGS